MESPKDANFLDVDVSVLQIFWYFLQFWDYWRCEDVANIAMTTTDVFLDRGMASSCVETRSKPIGSLVFFSRQVIQILLNTLLNIVHAGICPADKFVLMCGIVDLYFMLMNVA